MKTNIFTKAVLAFCMAISFSLVSNSQTIIWQKWNGASSFDPMPTSLPDVSEKLKVMDFGKDIDDNYVSRYLGFIMPDTTGKFVFYICSDDQSQLYLSTDSTAANKQLLCEETGWNGYNDFAGAPASDTIDLVAGNIYYIEALHKEGGVGDHCQVAWTGPGISSPAVIDSTYFPDIEMNFPPLIDQVPFQGPIANNASTQTLTLTGISPYESGQSITEVSAKPTTSGIIQNVSVNYTTGEDTAVLTYETAGGVGTDTIRVLVKDDGGTEYGCSDSTVMTFYIEVQDAALNRTPTINPIEDLPISSLATGITQTVKLTGITDGDDIHTQSLSVTATAPNDAIITNLVTNYVSDSTEGEVVFDITGTVGSVEITVTVTDGEEGVGITHGDNDSSVVFTVNIKEPIPGGEYTIGQGGDYLTIDEAFTTVELGGIVGPITFTLIDSMYDLGYIADYEVGVAINNIPGTSPTNTVTLKPAENQDSVVITSSNADKRNVALFALNGVDHLIIDGSNNGTNSRNLAFILGSKNYAGSYYSIRVDTATNITVKNVSSTDRANGGTGYVTSYSHRSFMRINKGKNFIIENNRAINHFDGILVSGSSTSFIDSVVIKDNYLGNPTDIRWSIKSQAIFLNNTKNILIHGNKIVNVSTVPEANWKENPRGIHLANGCLNTEISGNYINGVISHKTGYQANYPQGIRINHDTTGLVTIKNNFIAGIRHGSDLGSHNYISALSINNKMGPVHVYHNTIYMGDTVDQENNTKGIKGIEINSPGNGSCDIRNNIIAMPYSDTSSSPDNIYCIHTDNEFANDTVDYNVFYVDTSKSNTYICYAGGNSYATLADYQSYSFSSNMAVGANSHFAMPPFRGSNNLHIHPDSAFVGLDAGVQLGVQKDIDGEEREATPDIGADEVLPLPGIPSVSTDSIGYENIVISWNLLTDALSYDVEISEGDNDFNNIIVKETTSSTSYEASDLKHSTDYYCRVRGKNITGEGVWSDTIMISTLIPVNTINITAPGNVRLIKLDSTLQMNVEVLPVNATQDSVVWSVINETGNASITNDGLFTADSVGSVKVVATATDYTGESDTLPMEIYVPTQSISVRTEDGDTIVKVNRSTMFIADITPEEARDSLSFSLINVSGEANLYQGLTPNTCYLMGVTPGLIKLVAAAKDSTGITDTLELQVIQPVYNITVIGEDNRSFVLLDSTMQMIADVTPENATDSSVTWGVTEVSGSATIDANGLLTGDGIGSVKVSATANDVSGVTDTAIINIYLPANNISVTAEGGATELNISSTIQMTADMEPTGSIDDVVWSVDDINTASINNDGELTGIATGSITVTALAADGTGIMGTYDIEIVQPVTNITVSTASGNSSVKIDSTIQMIATIEPDDASNDAVIWEVDDASVATIDASGVLTGVSEGTVTITATADDGSGVYATKNISVEDHIGISSANIISINIYPNPANDILYVEPGIKGLYNVTITDLSGKVLLQKTNLNGILTINVSELEKGIHLLTITAGDVRETKELIVE
jgi:uncharacterized protein YjdB